MVVTSEDRMSCSVHLSEDGRSVVILDQRKLPNREEYLELKTAEEIFEAIRTLAVRGAPAIGICAAYGMYVLALREGRHTSHQFTFSSLCLLQVVGTVLGSHASCHLTHRNQ